MGYALYFVSSFSSLVCEMVFSRLLVLQLGNTTMAVSTILAAYMTGLALGGWFWGRRIDASRHTPLRVYGFLELATAPAVLVSPWLLGVVGAWEAHLAFGGSTGLFLRYLLCFGVLLPPAFFMGGTFAVMGRHTIGPPERFGSGASLLYGTGALGGLVGVLAAGFVLLRALGLHRSLWLAAGLSLAAGATALALGASLGASGAPAPRKKKTTRRRAEGPPLPVILLGAAVSGFAALALELLWTRLLLLVMDNSVYSFTTILAGFLVGLTLGGFLIAPLLDRARRPGVIFGGLLVLAGLAVYVFPRFVHLSPTPDSRSYLLFLITHLPAAILAPTILMGAILPAGVHLVHRRGLGVGRSLGAVYAVNCSAAALGAIVAGLVLIPGLGFRSSMLLIMTLYATAGGLVLVTACRRGKRAVAALVLLVVVGGWSQILPRDYFEKTYAHLEPESHLAYYKEGRAAAAAVFDRPDGVRSLYLNGIPEVDTTRLSIMTFQLLGTLPALLHPDPQNALMVTFGAGVSAGALEPLVKRVDCVDLADQARDIAGLFAPVNGKVLSRETVHIHVDDARHFLRRSTDRYSVIVSDATHPRSYDSWVLFTRDFYGLVGKRLRDDGIFAQWVPFHGLSPDQWKTIARTFAAAFEHTTVWRVDDAYAVLLATPRSLEIDFTDFSKRLARKEVKAMLKSAGLDNPFQYLAFFCLDEERLKTFLGEGGPVITDDRPRNLFFPPAATLQEQYSEWPLQNAASLKALSTSIAPWLIRVADTEAETQRRLAVLRQFEAANQ